MIEVGNYAVLEINREVDFGVYLDGGPLGEILMPMRYVVPNAKVGDEVGCFIYCDSEDRLIATTETPKLILNEIALLRIVDVSNHGAFAEWDISKDLLIPFAEQTVKLEAGRSYLVKLLFDEKTGRLFGSTKLSKHLEKYNQNFIKGQPVTFTIYNKTDLGFNVIIDHTFVAVLYENETFQKVKTGEIHQGFIKNIREDGKIDVALQADGFLNRIDSDTETLLVLLKKHNYIEVHDKSSPEIIYNKTKMSKKAFKKAVGNLYKQKLILLEDGGIRLVTED